MCVTKKLMANCLHGKTQKIRCRLVNALQQNNKRKDTHTTTTTTPNTKTIGNFIIHAIRKVN